MSFSFLASEQTAVETLDEIVAVAGVISGPALPSSRDAVTPVRAVKITRRLVEVLAVHATSVKLAFFSLEKRPSHNDFS
jgi:hypothetical protein